MKDTFTEKERRQEKRRRHRANRRDMWLERTPDVVYAELVSTNVYSRRRIGRLVFRALTGWILGGPFGAALLSYTARIGTSVAYATFSVRYRNGKNGAETVKVDSDRYYELLSLNERHERHP